MAIDRRTKVYKIGATYYAEKHDGTIISASGTFETVLQEALDNGSPLGPGIVWMEQPANFTFSASMSAPVILPSYTKLVMSAQTNLIVPAAFTGPVLQIGSSAAATVQAFIVGGQLSKLVENKNWIGIAFSANDDTKSIIWCGVHGTRVNKALSGLYFVTSGTGWIRDVDFRMPIMNECIVGVNFAGSGTAVEHVGYPDVAWGLFDRVICQDGHSLHDQTHGFKNIAASELTFRDCNVWDLLSNTQKTFTINPAAFNISIEGGIMTRRPGYFTDNSTTRGQWFGSNQWAGPSYGDMPLISSTFVRNGRRFGGFLVGSTSPTLPIGYGLTGANWTLDTTGTSAVTAFLSTNNTIGRLFTTGTTLGNGAGIHYQILITCRQWDPVYKIRFRQNTTSLCRLFFGWKASTSVLPTGDDPLNLTSGIYLCLRSADTNYQIASNDGTGATVFQDTGVAKNTAINTFELVAQDFATNKFKFSINNAAWVNVTTTTDIPAQTVGLCPVAEIQTNETAVAKNFDIFDLYVETD